MLLHIVKIPVRPHLYIAIALSLALAACDKEDDPDITAPLIEITFPEMGSNITGSADVTIQGVVSSDTARVEVTQVIEESGSETIFDANLSGTDFTADVTLGNNANTISTMAEDGTGNSTMLRFTLFYPVLALSNGMSASYVIGQNAFNANDPNRGSTVAANTLSGVVGTLIEWQNTRLYIPDTGNHRVLGFNDIPTASDVSANFVIGQDNLTSAVSDTTARRFSSPSGVYVTNTQFFVADTGNNRVLIWDTLPVDGNLDANYVVGQLDFTSAASGCSSSTLSGPGSVFVAGDKLVVADNVNQRVLIWNAIPTADGAAADIVIGQQNFDNCLPNDSDGDGVTDLPTASTLSNPGGIWTDGVRLLVADTGNHRVLLWNSFPTSNGQAADVVLGQTDMTMATAELSQSGLDSPKSVTSNGNQVVVADSGNVRVLVWNTIPASNKPDADRVIGQADFTSNTPILGQDTLTTADNVFVDRRNLFVVDGNRILMFVDPTQPVETE
ncbi:hypothetical protein [Kaarinaea lacus]